ncbi:unnamed protein product, partial [Chrysoparadoxa australica]
VCRVTIVQLERESKPYYRHRVNCGTAAAVTGAKEKRGQVLGEVQSSASSLSESHSERTLDLIDRIEAAFIALVPPIPTNQLKPKECSTLLEEREGLGFWKGRHLDQQASILGHMHQCGLIHPQKGTSGMTFLEMGAGRGMLGLALAKTHQESKLIFIERSGSRGKADRQLKDLGLEHRRVNIDISDLHLPGLFGHGLPDEQGPKSVVSIAKHLCGVATDFALRSLLTLASPDGSTDGSTATDEEEHQKLPNVVEAGVGGCCIATCCHHVCNYDDYVNKAFLDTAGFSKGDFQTMCKV